MAKKKKSKKSRKKGFGGWAFLVGFILALIFGIIGVSQVIAWILVVIGLIIGFLNITEKEVKPFLMSATVLVIISALGGNAMNIIPTVGNVLNAILLLFIPATVIVALKSAFALARDED
mgnify:CR=1 FL=1